MEHINFRQFRHFRHFRHLLENLSCQLEAKWLFQPVWFWFRWLGLFRGRCGGQWIRFFKPGIAFINNIPYQINNQ